MFNRYNTRRLKIDDTAIADKHIQGVFKATDPDEFAREVSRRFGIRVSFPASVDAKEGVIRLGGDG
jgi:ferric-dicitrate binding protein FerR (iron transport regulator)